MKIIKSSMVGTLESSDIQIRVEPKDEVGIKIQLKSSVEKQFGKQIKKVIIETLESLGIDRCLVIAIDKGALDCTIKARIQCATYRAVGDAEKINWEVMD